VVHFWPQAQRHYQVRVRLVHGSPGAFHVVVLAGGLGMATAGGSICFPADGPEVIAMGAVDERGRRLEYSCCGPNSSRPKPDFVAPVPFPLTGHRPPFGGTSAAAPQGAAVAALWLSRHPDWTAERVRTTLRKSARDLGPPGHDYETGYGMVVVPPPKPPAGSARDTSSRPSGAVVQGSARP
jgi:subtilisin family serine protease